MGSLGLIPTPYSHKLALTRLEGTPDRHQDAGRFLEFRSGGSRGMEIAREEILALR